jgi:serine phosphatase RsbU (regulator of sigma subunit)
MNQRLVWATRYEPGGRRALLGGDFFDAVETDDGTVRVVIGDVCGHGPTEAALGVALRVAGRALVLAGQPPEATLFALERILEVERASDEVFATLCDIEIEPRLEQAQLRVGGHPSPLLFDGATVREVPVEPRHPLLGWSRASDWASSPVELGAEWTLFVFTDGIIEGRSGSGDERLGTDGLARLASSVLEDAASLNAVAEGLVTGAESANRGPLQDDVALLVLSTARRWHQ